MASKNEWHAPLPMGEEETSGGGVVRSTAVDHFTFERYVQFNIHADARCGFCCFIYKED